MRDPAVDDDVAERRTTDYDIAPLILNRWSPRSMTGEPLSDSDLLPLFEAARWAPSSRNNQPWRFAYAKRETDDWDRFFALLNEGNQRWAKQAAALVVVLSRTTYDDGEPIRNGSFSVGMAWENLALEGTRRGLVVHPMQGFDETAARSALAVPEDLRVEIMTAIGVRGSRDLLTDRDREREFPSGRKPLQEVLIEGGFTR